MFRFGAMRPQQKRRTPHNLVMYQRDSNRMLLHEEKVMRDLQNGLGADWSLSTIIHSEDHHPCVLWSHLRGADVLLTPHGFQTILLLLMPKGSAVFEVFPFKYWKDGYRPLANEFGLWHGWSQNARATHWYINLALSFISQEQCMLRLDCREYARQDDVYMDAAATKAVTLLADHVANTKTRPRFWEPKALVPATDDSPPRNLVRRPAAPGADHELPAPFENRFSDPEALMKQESEFSLSPDANETDDPVMWTISPPFLTDFW